MASTTPLSARRKDRPRLFLADDHHLLLQSLSRCLEADYDIAGVAGSGDELMRCVPLPADCLLLDLWMPGWNGLDLIAPIRRRQPDLKIIVLTMVLDRRSADLAFRKGANGFVPKEVGIEEVKSAIREVLSGRRYLSPRVQRADHRVGTSRTSCLHQLTQRQEQIFLLLGEGLSAAQIARRLGVTRSTVSFHKVGIMRVLGITSEEVLVQYAVLARATLPASRREMN